MVMCLAVQSSVLWKSHSMAKYFCKMPDVPSKQNKIMWAVEPVSLQIAIIAALQEVVRVFWRLLLFQPQNNHALRIYTYDEQPRRREVALGRWACTIECNNQEVKPSSQEHLWKWAGAEHSRGSCLLCAQVNISKGRDKYRAPSTQAGWQARSLRSDWQTVLFGLCDIFLEFDLVVVRLGLFHMEIWVSGFSQSEAIFFWSWVWLSPWERPAFSILSPTLNVSSFFYVTCLAAT